MNSEDKVLRAVELKKSGACNCAQSVACVFCEEAGVDIDTMRAVTSAFGTGMGTTYGTCGALVGAGVVLGLVERDRVRARAVMKEVMEQFEQRNGATVCRALKGLDSGKMLRSCNDCVADATEITCKYLSQK
ncbi:MAG: C-GCAxxG-C-C family protein [Paramuribaculum sp.]|nr:C-GCAxxG-C-C family protein [Paramuribaculum sp.]